MCTMDLCSDGRSRNPKDCSCSKIPPIITKPADQPSNITLEKCTTTCNLKCKSELADKKDACVGLCCKQCVTTLEGNHHQHEEENQSACNPTCVSGCGVDCDEPQILVQCFKDKCLCESHQSKDTSQLSHITNLHNLERQKYLQLFQKQTADFLPVEGKFLSHKDRNNLVLFFALISAITACITACCYAYLSSKKMVYIRENAMT